MGTNYAFIAQHETPLTYDNAMSCPESDAWLEACQDELQSLKEIWTYVPVSMGDIGAANIVGCHWVFAIKHGLNGSVE